MRIHTKTSVFLKSSNNTIYKRFSTAQPRYTPASHGLDPQTRLQILIEESKLNWNGEYNMKNDNENALIREFQEKLLKYRNKQWNPSESESTEFQHQRNLAMTAYHRAMLRFPSFLLPLQPPELKKSPFYEGQKLILPIFTSQESLNQYYQGKQIPQAAPAHGDMLISFLVDGQPPPYDYLAVDPAPDMSSHHGLPSHEDMKDSGIQSAALMFPKLIKEGRMNDPVALQIHVACLFTQGYIVYYSGAVPNQMFVQTFVSNTHREAALFALNRKQTEKFEPRGFTWQMFLDRFPGLPNPPIIGFTLDRLSPEFEPFAGRDCENDKLDMMILTPTTQAKVNPIS